MSDRNVSADLSEVLPMEKSLNSADNQYKHSYMWPRYGWLIINVQFSLQNWVWQSYRVNIQTKLLWTSIITRLKLEGPATVGIQPKVWNMAIIGNLHYVYSWLHLHGCVNRYCFQGCRVFCFNVLAINSYACYRPYQWTWHYSKNK